MRRALGLLLLACLAGGEAEAWPSSLMKALAGDARRLLPHSLARLLWEREAQILDEAGRLPPELTQALVVDLNEGRLQPETIAALDARAAQAVDLMRLRRVNEGLVSLGAILRVPADLSDPVLAVGRTGFPAGVTREYYAFVEQSLAKMPVVLDDAAALKLDRRRLPGYWQDLLGRSRAQSPVISLEMFRDGRVVDHRTLDYRSPVFGVASLSYSRAVTAIAATWLVLWREAKGDLTQTPAPTEVRPRDESAGAVYDARPATTSSQGLGRWNEQARER